MACIPIPIVQPTSCTCYLKLFIPVKRCTCFGRSFLPSSGAQNCITATVYVKQLLLSAAIRDERLKRDEILRKDGLLLESHCVAMN
jgi:hypothetical protein